MSPVSAPVLDDPDPVEFVDSLFGWLRAAIALSDARYEERLAAKKNRRREQAREYRADAARRLPAALEQALRGIECERIEFDGGFHIEPSDPRYRPSVGELLRITFLTESREISATRKPKPGRTELSRPVTPHGAIRLLREMAAGVKEYTSWIFDASEGCQCHNVANPPCAYCENGQWCEECAEAFGPDEWDDHVDEHKQGLIGRLPASTSSKEA